MYELRNRNQRFLCDSLICGEVLIHKNSSPSLRGLRRLSGAPYGPNRSDWAFALLRTAPRGFALASCAERHGEYGVRREETLRKKTAYETLIHISLNSTKIHMSGMELLVVQSVFDEAF